MNEPNGEPGTCCKGCGLPVEWHNYNGEASIFVRTKDGKEMSIREWCDVIKSCHPD